jgi:hypothetical protein
LDLLNHTAGLDSSAPWGTAGRRTASSPGCSSCPNGTFAVVLLSNAGTDGIPAYHRVVPK